MQCDKNGLLLLASGELDSARGSKLEQHVAECDACADELARLRENLTLLQSLVPMEPSGEAVDRILTAGREAVRRQRTVRPAFWHRWRYALATAAALMMIIGWSVLQNPVPDDSCTLTDAQLDRLWQQPVAQMTSGGAAVLDVADQVTGDAWGLSADQVLAQIDESEIRSDLLELEETLDQLEGLSWDS